MRQGIGIAQNTDPGDNGFMARVIQEKLRRLREGRCPRVLDLFAGCGGLSLGFDRAGFKVSAAVELDPEAIESHALNFFRSADPGVRGLHAVPRDITATSPAALARELGHRGSAASFVDVIVGGPPCQAFARVGRAKLREVAEHPRAFKQDPRGNLYLRYLQYVEDLRPLALVMENVPDVLNYGGHNIAEEMCEVLADLGYRSGYTLLNAVYYGVPQMRERMFLVAYREELGLDPSFPSPTHWAELPRGYENSRQVALKTIARTLFDDDPFYQEPPVADRERCLRAVTAEEALRDLPVITAHLEGKLKRGRRDPRETFAYGAEGAASLYAQAMKVWPGFEVSERGTGHVIRYLPRDYEIFRRMQPGDQYPEAYHVALRLFEERLAAAEAQQGPILRGTKLWKRIWSETVPPYDPGKFPNKWRKMEADRPARTLMAHLGKDSYSHIHYDSAQARTISVREAARLQSFPDGFLFAGSMNPAFRQIGNAVPPLLAYAVGKQVACAMGVRPNG